MTFTFPGWCSWWWGRSWWFRWWWWWRSWWSWIHNGFLSTEHCPFIDAQPRYPWSSLPLTTTMMKMMWFVKIKTMTMMKVWTKMHCSGKMTMMMKMMWSVRIKTIAMMKVWTKMHCSFKMIMMIAMTMIWQWEQAEYERENPKWISEPTKSDRLT